MHIYVMTGNYGVETNGRTISPAAGDLAESLVKLEYTPPAAVGGDGGYNRLRNLLLLQMPVLTEGGR